MTEMADLELAGEFEPASREQWLELVGKVLKGASLEDKLVSRTYDGIEIQPLYVAEDVEPATEWPGTGQLRRGAGPPNEECAWRIRTVVAGPDPAVANAQALEDLERGATALRFELEGSAAGGVALDSEAASRLFDGILFDLIDVSFSSGTAYVANLEHLADAWHGAGLSAQQLRGSLCADPIGFSARSGEFDHGLEVHLSEVVSFAQACRRWPNLRAIEIDGTVYSDGGGSEAQELGALIAAGAAYLRGLVSAGWSVNDAAKTLSFRTTVDADVFASIAKLRAFRTLWSYIISESGGDLAAAAAPVDVVTAATMHTRRDPWVNILRTTAAGFAAGVGGATSVTVRPFDEALGEPDELARRVARNTQLLLQEESHVGEVIDAAGGSWYVESLTDQLAAAGWAQFVKLEKAGGIWNALASGSFADDIAAVAQQRSRNISTRRDPLTGVSEFPNLHEDLPVRPHSAEAVAGGDHAIKPFRRAAAFETLRDQGDELLAATGTRPGIFLATLGPVAVHTARASFAKNFFEACGIEALGFEGSEDPDLVAEAFVASGACLAVICSSDGLYETMAVGVAQRLKAAGAKRVYLAGNPGALREDLELAGVDEFIKVGTNVVECGAGAYEILGGQ